MDRDFLLNSKTAKILYSCAEKLPVVDYHNHLSAEDIIKNKRFCDIYELWVKPDPYKHRAMRMCGVPEKYITGSGTDKEKFFRWCETVPKLIGNPLYHWTQMELFKFFGITEMPNGKNSEKLYGLCNDYLKKHEVTVNTLLEKFNVEYACPCASLTDDISIYKNSSKLSPSLRGDDIVNLTPGFVKKLEALAKIKITDLTSLKKAIILRLDEFKRVGCCFSDHALDSGFMFYDDDNKNDKRFELVLSQTADKDDKDKFSSYMLAFLGREYAKLGFVMQLHTGAKRYTSTRLRSLAGAAGGFAGIGNTDVSSLTRFLDTLDNGDYGLPKTVLFTLNPAENALMSALSGSYSKDGVSGIITQGPAWWWCDHKLGIKDVLENAAAFGVLSNFIGMTTDSRSFLSFVRHDYFRRILCNWVAEKAELKEFPSETQTLEKLVKKICYENAHSQVKRIKGER